MNTASPKKETYASAVEKLQAIVASLEEETPDIDELTQKLKEAQRLLAYCKQKLTKTEAEAQKILESMQ